MNLSNKSNLFYTTSTVLEWQSVLLFPGVIDIIYQTWNFLYYNKRIQLYSYVIMPNHIHWLYQVLPPFTNEQIKHSFHSFTAKAILEILQEDKAYFYVDKTNRKYQFWKSPSLSVPIFSNEFFLQKLNYIHSNPKRAGILDENNKYEHSSLNAYLNQKTDKPFLCVVSNIPDLPY